MQVRDLEQALKCYTSILEQESRNRRALEAKGVTFKGETVDSGVCHMGFFEDPDGNTVILHRRYKPYE